LTYLEIVQMNKHSRIPARGPRLSPLAVCLTLAYGLAESAAALAQSAPARGSAPVGSSATGLGQPQSLWAWRFAASDGVRRHTNLYDAPPHQPAATIEVTNCNDHGSGSLRNAINNANSGDTVDLTHLSCSNISLTTGELAIAVADLYLVGPGADALTIDGGLSNGYYNRVIAQTDGGTLYLGNLTITDAKYRGTNEGRGGCIYSRGTVELNHTIVSHCSVINSSTGTNFGVSGGGVSANGLVMLFSTVTDNILDRNAAPGAFGAGVYCFGNFTAKYSTISDNIASSSSYSVAGGVRVVGGTATLLGTTISGNTASFGGGIQHISFGADHYAAQVINSTISGNSGGGGDFESVDLNLDNSTIAFNTEHYGLMVSSGSADLQSSIIALNSSANGATDFDTDASTTVTGADNLITSSKVTVPSGTSTKCPLLAPLADNGGTTLTHALLVNSPAIDAGNNTTNKTTDQRGTGYARVVGAHADIGAFERQAGEIDDVIFMSKFQTRCL
jgi:hypothetical protein